MAQKMYNHLVENAFENYMKHSCKFKDNTVRSYLSSMRTATKILRNDHKIYGDIYDLKKFDLHKAVDYLCENQSFVDKDVKSSYRYSHALGCYFDFVDILSSGVLN